MSVALTSEQRMLGDVVRGFVDDADVRRAARDALDAATEQTPPFWKDLAAAGWTGLHLPESYGGQGAGLAELAVVVEQLGRVCAPGPFLSSAIGSAVIASSGDDEQRRALLPALAAGTRTAAVGLGGSLVRAVDGTLSGDAGPLLGAGLADLFLLTVGDDIAIVERDADGAAGWVGGGAGGEVEVIALDSLDPTRRQAAVTCAGARPTHILPGAARAATRIARVLAAAEAAGIARACVDTAAAYAKIRRQFGRSVGAFQAVAHHCANMLVDAELAAAAAWDAARAVDAAGSGARSSGTRSPGARSPGAQPDLAAADLAAAAAAAIALPGALRCAQRNIQVHGGIGYTWEHDAHLFLRRAATLLALFDADAGVLDDLIRLHRARVRRPPAVELPPEAEAIRAEVRRFRERYEALPAGDRRGALIDSGYLVPHYPKPYGRGAGPLEQLVIEAELGDLAMPDLGIGAWILPTLIQHGTPDQLESWIRPSLEGALRWCQLFSEPEAGSDAAAIRTRGVRVEGGWRLNGQKIWTSDAARCNRGLATVRTDPEAPKHAGVTMMVVDLAAPGVEVRPLREITGEAMFNEVFLTDVFVPDPAVVGPVGQGWKVARAALGNERVTIGSGRAGGEVVTAGNLPGLLARYRPGDAGLARDTARLLAEEQAMVSINLRAARRALAGESLPPAEGNITKLLSAEHSQRVADLAMTIAGGAGVSGAEPGTVREMLYARCLTIGGGTSEISRNQIAERLLGLPRDPLLS